MHPLASYGLKWVALQVGLAAFYEASAAATACLMRRNFPSAPANRCSLAKKQEMAELSHAAFWLYAGVPLLVDGLADLRVSRVCHSVSECGGWALSLVEWGAYLLLVEVLVFGLHYFVLHKSWVGRWLGDHAAHHAFRRKDEVCAYTSFAFAAQDGFLQGLPIALATCVVPVPLCFVYCTELLTAAWTIYIHCGKQLRLPWPFLGADYHEIHHSHNWFNFGFFTVLCDSLAGTLYMPRRETSQ